MNTSGMLVILDRDGVINFDSEDFIKSEREWKPIPGSLEAIGRLSRAGYRVVVASNQSGLAAGRFTVDDLHAIHGTMLAQASRFGGAIEAIFFCPHGPEAGCECRKPRPGLLLEIGERLHVSLENVHAVGDRLTDIEAATAAGASPVLVRSGHGREIESSGRLPGAIPVYDDLAAFADALLESE